MAGKKKSNGEGSIYKRSDGRWCATIQIGTKDDGKPIKKSFYGHQRKNVVSKLDDYKFKLHTGDIVSANEALDSYILNWLRVVKFGELKPASYDRLESTIQNYINPNLGFYKIDEITSMLIQTELINKMTSKQLSYSSIKKAYDGLNSCLKYAVANQHLKYNPMQTVVKPATNKFAKKQITIFTDEEVKSLIENCNVAYSNNIPKYKMGNAFILILNTGLRLGELSSLKWNDINFDKRTLKVDSNMIMSKNRNKTEDSDPNHIFIEQDTTKTKKSSREIYLNDKSITALNKIKLIRYSGDNGYVICSDKYKPIRPRNLQNTFDYILNNAGINHSGIHTLRHTFASMLFKQGADIKTVSEILGHEDVRTTANIYLHIMQEQKSDAIKALDNL